ncbi:MULTISPECIES: caspase family protein [Pseudomonas]|uniref:Uncharacterized protein, contains caspase domain n=1 Tax=Pseudomonas trivialis TaxID=200450 RepID=A0ABY0UFL1_9PSED|nr:caspase family protein [Pseudomonas trivialis]MEE4183094.1 caspase family protein [Pseudomonas viridiflava]SDS59454.1 Uncharacterized protein, contains caspase domain [Pseudomonas trivialis]
MGKKVTGRSAGKAIETTEICSGGAPKRVTAVVVALENYRRDELPVVDFAHADADGFAAALRQIYPAEILHLDVIKDEDATLSALQAVSYTIQNLEEDELFIFYYAGHGFHGAGQNRLSAFDTNRFNFEGTTLSLQSDLLEHLEASECSQALIFVDACAANFAQVINCRDVISNLEPLEVENFLDGNWYCGVFLSCSPQEKSYPAQPLGHGIWTHFLLEALEGRADGALRDRWLTDASLRDYLQYEVRRYITHEMTIKASQTPQAILSGSGSFRIRYIEEPSIATAPASDVLAKIIFQNNTEFLESAETGRIRSLAGFSSKYREPIGFSESADKFCRTLLDTQIKEEIQEIYQATIAAFGARRKDVQKGEDYGAGDVAYEYFRYSVNSGQNPDDHSEFVIYRTLQLRDGWHNHREAIEDIFDRDFDHLVIDFARLKLSFDDLVDSLEDVRDAHGGEIDDDDRTMRVTYSTGEAAFTFDLRRHRLEIQIAGADALDILDGVKHFQLGNAKPSPMLEAPLK